MKRLAFIILVSAVFAACTKKSNQIDTNDIYQVIRIEYHEDINQTHVKYKLKRKKESGASIEFVDGDQVSIMGIIQSYEGAGSYPYEAEFYNFIDSVYTTVTHKGTTINNYGLIGNVYAIQIPSTLTVYKNYSWYFTWTGMPIMGSNDEIKIEINLYFKSTVNACFLLQHFLLTTTTIYFYYY